MATAPDEVIPAFDAWLNLPASWDQMPRDPNVTHLFRNSGGSYQEGTDISEVVDQMMEHGVVGAVLTGFAREFRVPHLPSFEIDDDAVRRICADVAEAVSAHPGLFVPAVMLDTRHGYGAARHLRIAVEEFGIQVVRIMPSHSLLKIDDALCYPLYTAACDLGVPVTINVGVPGPMKPARFQDPMPLDDVALAFPDLTLVMTHVGKPWISEVVALLERHPNVYLMTSGWAPKYLPAEIRQFMSTRGQSKVMWASDYPVLPIERTVREGREIDVRPEALPKYMCENAQAVFASLQVA